jgi:hypothetical protein
MQLIEIDILLLLNISSNLFILCHYGGIIVPNMNNSITYNDGSIVFYKYYICVCVCVCVLLNTTRDMSFTNIYSCIQQHTHTHTHIIFVNDISLVVFNNTILSSLYI